MRLPMFVLALALALPAARAQERSDAEAAHAALRVGAAVVVLMRHAEAPGPAGDPPGFKLDDCRTQRNLSPQGREDARRVGDELRRRKAVIREVRSSPWCRSLDTARALRFGAVKTEPAFGNAFVQADRRAELTAAALNVVRGWRGPGALLVVSHGENISALTGVALLEGESVVVRARADGSLQVLGRLPLPP